MKPDDIQFVRETYKRLEPDPMQVLTWVEGVRLLTLLIESEAMREKAEYWRRDFWHNMTDINKESWSDADWFAAKKKEWGI